MFLIVYRAHFITSPRLKTLLRMYIKSTPYKYNQHNIEHNNNRQNVKVVTKACRLHIVEKSTKGEFLQILSSSQVKRASLEIESSYYNVQRLQTFRSIYKRKLSGAHAIIGLTWVLRNKSQPTMIGMEFNSKVYQVALSISR